jgi:hypothetical protein
MNESLLLDFDSLGLDKLGEKQLLNRVDRKFYLKLSLLPEFLSQLSSHYSVLEVNGQRRISYQTQYFDTADRAFYMMHHNGRSHRIKIRHRTYGSGGLNYWEIKLRDNKLRTKKLRKATNNSTHVQEELNEWLKNFDYLIDYTIEPVLEVGYKRFTMVSKHYAERVTVDTDLTFKCSEKSSEFNGLVIVEVKQSSLKGSIAAEALKKMGIRQGGLSKYCTGLASLDNSLKQNNFKPKLKGLIQMLTYPLSNPSFYA